MEVEGFSFFMFGFYKILVLFYKLFFLGFEIPVLTALTCFLLLMGKHCFHLKPYFIESENRWCNINIFFYKC